MQAGCKQSVDVLLRLKCPACGMVASRVTGAAAGTVVCSKLHWFPQHQAHNCHHSNKRSCSFGWHINHLDAHPPATTLVLSWRVSSPLTASSSSSHHHQDFVVVLYNPQPGKVPLDAHLLRSWQPQSSHQINCCPQKHKGPNNNNNNNSRSDPSRKPVTRACRLTVFNCACGFFHFDLEPICGLRLLPFVALEFWFPFRDQRSIQSRKVRTDSRWLHALKTEPALYGVGLEQWIRC